MRSIFITAANTRASKTFVSAVLTKNLNAVYFKPFQSGLAVDEPDAEVVRRLTGLDKARIPDSPIRLQAPLAPPHAAIEENITLSFEQISLPKTERILVIEGAGGFLSPLTDTQTNADLAKYYDIPILIIARNILGTISQTLLTIESARNRGIEILGVIMSGEPIPANTNDIAKLGKVDILGEVPWFNDEILPKSSHFWINSQVIQEKLHEYYRKKSYGFAIAS
jgi:malonyl-CoA O-methyltransferase